MNDEILKLTDDAKKPTMEEICHACEVQNDKIKYSNEERFEQYKILFIAAIFDLNRQKIDATDANIKVEINNIIFNYTISQMIKKGLIEEIIMGNGELGYKMA